jgi:hypothetical protein
LISIIDPQRCDSVVNKTGISARTNRIIGGKAPSEYLARLKASLGIDDQCIRKILESHVIDPDSLTADNFEDFFRIRSKALLERIERAMGKQILVSEQATESEDVAADYQDENGSEIS